MSGAKLRVFEFLYLRCGHVHSNGVKGNRFERLCMWFRIFDVALPK